MSIKESRFNKKFRSELAQRSIQTDRIESHATAPGIPDNAFIHDLTGLSGWIEVKEELTIPKRVKYRPKQALWHHRHHRRRGNVMTIIHIQSTKQVVLVPGDCALKAEKDLRSLITTGEALVFDLANGWNQIANAVIDQCRHTRRQQ